jgi:hypothetical protein
MYMGAPGTWYWQGQMHSTSMKEPEDLLSTVEGPPSADDSYLGYSTVVGQFNADRQDGQYSLLSYYAFSSIFIFLVL